MIINHDAANRLKERYPAGTRIELCSMNDPLCPVPSGTKGTVEIVDDAGTIHIHWDNGRTLGLIQGEDSFRKIPDEINTVKLYMPLNVKLFERNDYGDINNVPYEIDSLSVIALKDNIIAAIKYNELPEEQERGLMEWYNKKDSVNEKVLSLRPSVEEVDGRLMGVVECHVNGKLTDTELNELKEYVSGQVSDGWGEGFEQRALTISEGEAYVSFWNSNQGWKISTAEELKVLSQEQSLSDMSI